jgi:hypothetical protein
MDMTYKTYDTPDGERDPTAQDKIKPRNHSMKGHITGGDDNIKHMTNRMVKSIPNRKKQNKT